MYIKHFPNTQETFDWLMDNISGGWFIDSEDNDTITVMFNIKDDADFAAESISN